MTNTRLSEIRERCEAATPGPWFNIENWAITTKRDNPTRANFLGSVKSPIADFVAHSREDIPFLLAEIDRLSEAQRWIPVTERLPEQIQHENGEPVEYIVMIRGAKVPTTLSFDGKEWRDFWRDGSYGTAYIVTHWQPLPAAIEKGAENNG